MKRTRHEAKTSKGTAEVSIEPSNVPKLHTSRGRVAPILSSFTPPDSTESTEEWDYSKYFTDMDMQYLSDEYGILTEAIPVRLNPQETALQSSIATLLKLIDENLNYWSRKNAPITQDGLHKAKSSVLGLLTAIRYHPYFFNSYSPYLDRSPEHRLEYTLAAIYGKDLKSLMCAIRSPSAKDERGAALRENIVDTRNQFKSGLRQIVHGLKELLTSQIDHANFQRIMDAPQAEIEKYLEKVQFFITRFFLIFRKGLSSRNFAPRKTWIMLTVSSFPGNRFRMFILKYTLFLYCFVKRVPTCVWNQAQFC